MKNCGYLRQGTAVNKAIGQLISYADGKTSYSDAIGGNDNFDPTKLKCTLTKGITQSTLELSKTESDAFVVSAPDVPAFDGEYYPSTPIFGRLTYKKSGDKYLQYDSGQDKCYLFDLNEFDEFIYFWQKSGSDFVGTYTSNPADNIGIATVATTTNVVNLIDAGLASLSLSFLDTNTLGDLIISLEDADSDDPQILSESFLFQVIPTAVYDSLFGSSAAALATAAAVTALSQKITDEVVNADGKIDISNPAQFQAVKFKAGDPTTEYARKDIKDVDGNPVTSTNTVIGQMVEPVE